MAKKCLQYCLQHLGFTDRLQTSVLRNFGKNDPSIRGEILNYIVLTYNREGEDESS